MNFYIRKFQLAAAVLGVIATSPLLANDCYTPQFCCPQESCGQLFFDAEALYLRAYQGGLSSPCDNSDIVDSTVGGVVVSNQTGRGHEPRFKWDWGFRIGAGYDFADNSSEARVYWTHLDSKTGGSEINWKVNYDVVDLLYGYNLHLSNCFTVTAVAGLKYANIDQRVHTNFSGTIDGLPVSSTGFAKQDLSAIGPCIGLVGDFNVGCGLGIYGNVAVSCLYGRAHVHFTETDISNTELVTDSFRTRPQAYQYVVDAGLGFNWKTTLMDKLLVLQLGFESHRYFNNNYFFDYGDFSLDGLTLGASFYY
jgi:hypothetical protein